MNSAFIRVTALVIGALFLIAALFAAVQLWREGDILGNPKVKIAAAWLMSGAVFLAIGLRGWRRKRSNPDADLKGK